MDRKPDPLYAASGIAGPKQVFIGSSWCYLGATADGTDSTTEQRGVGPFSGIISSNSPDDEKTEVPHVTAPESDL